ncbi:MAG: STAS-like domain-containing protein [Phycisphaerales bacterium]
MNDAFKLGAHGKHLWTRAPAQQLRELLSRQLRSASPGKAVVIDARDVEAFDFSFANEFFGKAQLSLRHEFVDRFLFIEGLTEYTRENLNQALEGLSLVMIERRAGLKHLLGKLHPVDVKTFGVIDKAAQPISAASLSQTLDVNQTAMNERLGKLVELCLIWRTKGVSPAGREQYLYEVPA